MKNSLYIILLLFFFSCQKKKCNAFNYNQFKIDTIALKENSVFKNKQDTLLFKFNSLSIENIIYEENKFTSLKKCTNGFKVSYYCNKIGLNYEITFITTDDGNFFNFISNNFKLSEKIDFKGFQFNKIEDLNFELNSTNPHSIIKKILIKNGKIISFVDENALLWQNTY